VVDICLEEVEVSLEITLVMWERINPGLQSPEKVIAKRSVPGRESARIGLKLDEENKNVVSGQGGIPQAPAGFVNFEGCRLGY